MFSASLKQVQKKYKLDPRSSFLSRIDTTPVDIIKNFRDAGMAPTEHKITVDERKIISAAFETLPPLHQQVLKQHLNSISFLDNMPNTALTSPVTSDQDGFKLYHITFRAGILHQSISEWITEKERTCFEPDSSVTVHIQAGLLSALTFVLLHEGTHVLDGSLGLITPGRTINHPQINSFTANFAKGLWKDITKFDWQFSDSLLLKSRFRQNGKRFAGTEAPKVYQALNNAPFPSLYSMASWHEDLAELVTLHHITHKLKQPLRVLVKQNGKEIFSYEPMHSELIKKRIPMLKLFYSKKNPLHLYQQ